MRKRPNDTESCFVSVGGLSRVYNPGCGKPPSVKKHPCPDCHFCQSCSEARCHACRSQAIGACGKQGCGKLSLSEQIALFERMNEDSRIGRQAGSDACPTHE